MHDQDLKLLFAVVVVVIAGGAAWYFWGDLQEAQVDQSIEIAPDVPDTEAVGPRHPIEPPAISDPAATELVPLPRLDESDDYFLLALADLLGPDITQLLVNEALIDKFVATIDNLPRNQVSEKIRPAGRLTGSFVVAGDDGLYLGSENFRRYDALVGFVAAANPDEAVAMYRRFYPLLQESYVRLGYPNGYFNDRAVEVIDHLLLTPEPDGPLQLVQPHVLYEFADPELESLSSGQKLLLRMGTQHTRTIKNTLRELRSRISNTGSAP